jgi:hypothetical protein
MGGRVRRRIGEGEGSTFQRHETVYGSGPSQSLEHFSSVLKKLLWNFGTYYVLMRLNSTKSQKIITTVVLFGLSLLCNVN